MRSGLTEIVLVLDRSGSMEAIKNDAEGGMRVFVEGQRKAPGEARLTFYRFDTEIERVIEDRNIRFVEDRELKLEPRGGTALLDTMGRAINEVGRRLSNRHEDERPEHVIFVTVTDGEENSSHEFSGDKIKEMIKRQRDQYKWEFIFIGCTEGSIQMAQSLGYYSGQTLWNQPTGKSYLATYAVMTSNVAAMRSTGDRDSLNFTAEQRDSVRTDSSDDSVVQTTTGKPTVVSHVPGR